MKRKLEKVSILALSLMLISSFSISSALPLMLEYYKEYSADQVELLVSMPSFFVMLTLLCNRWLTAWLKESQMIVLGLLTVAVAGLVPFFNQTYAIVLFSRMFFGIGTGLINAKAISIISERYKGRERIQLLGLRGSAEVVGSAFFTLLVGQAIKVAWNWAFLIYAFAFVILLFYLLFVPRQAERVRFSQPEQSEGLGSFLLGYSLSLALLAGWMICINSSISLRVPVLVVDQAFGQATEASLVLMAQQLIGIVAGLAFAPLLERGKERLLGLAIGGLGFSLMGLFLSPSLSLLTTSAIGTGFFYSLILTTIFHRLSEKIPPHLLNTATALVLVGCNSGSALSPYVLKLLGMFSSDAGMIFAFYAASCFVLGVGVSALVRKEKTHALR